MKSHAVPSTQVICGRVVPMSMRTAIMSFISTLPSPLMSPKIVGMAPHEAEHLVADRRPGPGTLTTPSSLTVARQDVEPAGEAGDQSRCRW